jgi:hypothetical protein
VIVVVAILYTDRKCGEKEPFRHVLYQIQFRQKSVSGKERDCPERNCRGEEVVQYEVLRSEKRSAARILNM